MKNLFLNLTVIIVLFASCSGMKNRMIFIPDTDQGGEQPADREIWQIVESQNGAADADVPDWVGFYLDGDARENSYRKTEALNRFNGKYIFVGENHGDNINILSQWAKGYSPAYDLPRLVVQRVEKRLVAGATLYPDDEYGEYFVGMIRGVSDGDFSGGKPVPYGLAVSAEKNIGAVIEDTFWVKRKLISGEGSDAPLVTERYEIFILLSIDRATLEGQLREIMADVRRSVSVTRDQSGAISRVQNNFFEVF